MRSGSKQQLLANQILAHIQRAGGQNNGALDDILQVRVDAQHVERDKDDAQDKHAEDNAADVAGIAEVVPEAERYAGKLQAAFPQRK